MTTGGLISRGTAGEVNRARVLQALYDAGPLSRADLARLSGVTRAAIGRIVGDMLAEGILTEQDPLPSSAAGGKPSRPLWFARHAPPILAVHLLPDTIEAALIGAGGDIQRTVRTGHDRSTGAATALITLLRQLLDHAHQPPIGIGIAVAGMVNTDTGTIVRVNLAPHVDGLALGPIVEDAISLPTWIDHHPRVQALGDRWFGPGRGHADFVSLYVAEAVGAGLVIGGTVHRGPAGAGGEVGHTTVQLGGSTCRCGRIGCWETIASHDWLRDQARRHGLPGAATLTAGPLASLAARGIPGAAQLLDAYAHNLAIGIANIHQTLAPELFILHGDATTGGEALRSRIEAHVRQMLPPHPAGPPHLTFSTLHDHATLLGAAGLVLSQTLQLTA